MTELLTVVHRELSTGTGRRGLILLPTYDDAETQLFEPMFHMNGTGLNYTARSRKLSNRTKNNTAFVFELGDIDVTGHPDREEALYYNYIRGVQAHFSIIFDPNYSRLYRHWVSYAHLATRLGSDPRIIEVLR